MRVKVNYTVDVTDDYRRAIRNYYGKQGLATREEVQTWLERYGNSMDDDLMVDLEEATGDGGGYRGE